MNWPTATIVLWFSTLWLMGIVFVQGFWLTLAAILFPPYGILCGVAWIMVRFS